MNKNSCSDSKTINSTQIPIATLSQNIEKAIKGKQDAIQLLIAAMLAGGHVLIEDVPGTAKTTLAKALAASLGVGFGRVQFTPDLMPGDITGGAVWDPGAVDFKLVKGPVFTNVFLADEINRASPRTQSALLQAMEESKVSLDGNTLQLPDFFMVLATQNPVEYHGVYPLPEAQMDRFMVRLSLGYPSAQDEMAVICDEYTFVDDVQPVWTEQSIYSAKQGVEQVKVHEDLVQYIYDLIAGTRAHGGVRLGASPRAGKALYKMSKALAFVQQRDFVKPADIQRAWVPVIAHRLSIHATAKLQDVMQDVLQGIAVPV
jgi:MoxR-like ATPase